MLLHIDLSLTFVLSFISLLFENDFQTQVSLNLTENSTFFRTTKNVVPFALFSKNLIQVNVATFKISPGDLKTSSVITSALYFIFPLFCTCRLRRVMTPAVFYPIGLYMTFLAVLFFYSIYGHLLVESFIIRIYSVLIFFACVIKSIDY